VALVSTRIRVFLTVVSLIFAGLLAIQFVATLLHPVDPPSPAAARQQVVDRPTDVQSAPSPPRSPSGRGLIRHAAQWAATAG
jgi:hypothetical protein